MSAKTTELQTNESTGYTRVSNHEDCAASGWSVVNGFMRAKSPNLNLKQCIEQAAASKARLGGEVVRRAPGYTALELSR